MESTRKRSTLGLKNITPAEEIVLIDKLEKLALPYRIEQDRVSIKFTDLYDDQMFYDYKDILMELGNDVVFFELSDFLPFPHREFNRYDLLEEECIIMTNHGGLVKHEIWEIWTDSTIKLGPYNIMPLGMFMRAIKVSSLLDTINIDLENPLKEILRRSVRLGLFDHLPELRDFAEQFNTHSW